MHLPPRRTALHLGICSALLSLAQSSHAVHENEAQALKVMGTVTIVGGQPSSLPTHIPTTMEGITAAQIAQQINASDSEDALKYFPSLLVRKRYIGDYNHAVLSSRASGTGNSARSAVYADGILLSNYLGNGATFTPRWGLVTPEEIERADVMYGPFSAAYPGNSVGAVVDYVTRMPKKLEAHAQLSLFAQPFSLYQSNTRYHGRQFSASLGNRHGAFSWWLNLNRSENEGQPLTFATRALSSSAPAANAVPVSGAVAGLDRSNNPWWIVGAGVQYHTRQEHAKIKFAYDFTPTLRAGYSLGWWQNSARARSASYLKDANGKPVYSGAVNIAGRGYTLQASDFAANNDELAHLAHGLSLKSHTRGVWDWELAASSYQYQRDQQRSASQVLPLALQGGPGSLSDMDGSGWRTLAAKGIWRPKGSAHVLEFGWQDDAYKLHIRKTNLPTDWRNDPAPGTGLQNEVGGKTALHSLWLQDRIALAPDWLAVLGLRFEEWQASGGYTRFSAKSSSTWPQRRENYLSPKAALSWQVNPHWVVKASSGRAVRMPTVSELYGATSSTNSQYINDPHLRPEKSWTHELSAETEIAHTQLRATLFAEDVRDSLYTQTTYDAQAGANISRVQNLGRIRTHGLELAANGQNVFYKGLDLQASLTYADSRIKENSGFVSVPGDTLNKYQARVPLWRASAVASYQFTPTLRATLGARYSGRQYSTLNNSDPNGNAYQGSSKFFTTDLRLTWQAAKEWTAAFGIDNLNNCQYWNFHPYPQRSYSAQLRYDLK